MTLHANSLVLVLVSGDRERYQDAETPCSSKPNDKMSITVGKELTGSGLWFHILQKLLIKVYDAKNRSKIGGKLVKECKE